MSILFKVVHRSVVLSTLADSVLTKSGLTKFLLICHSFHLSTFIYSSLALSFIHSFVHSIIHSFINSSFFFQQPIQTPSSSSNPSKSVNDLFAKIHESKKKMNVKSDYDVATAQGSSHKKQLTLNGEIQNEIVHRPSPCKLYSRSHLDLR